MYHRQIQNHSYRQNCHDYCDFCDYVLYLNPRLHCDSSCHSCQNEFYATFVNCDYCLCLNHLDCFLYRFHLHHRRNLNRAYDYCFQANDEVKQAPEKVAMLSVLQEFGAQQHFQIQFPQSVYRNRFRLVRVVSSIRQLLLQLLQRVFQLFCVLCLTLRLANLKPH